MSSKFKLNKMLTIPVSVVLIFIIVLSFINQDAFSTFMSTLIDVEVVDFKWIIGPTILYMLITAVLMLAHPIGKIRLGGADAKPKFKTFSYWGLCICSTIAIGIVFYGVVQPLTYFEEPWPSWGEAESATAAVHALAQNNLEWAWGQYVQYLIWAIVLGIAIYNLKQPERMSSFLYVLTGKEVNKKLAFVIDLIGLIGIITGVTASLGQGTMQFSAGLNAVFGIHVSKGLWLVVEAIIVIGFLLMSVGGIAKAIKFVTDQNFGLYIIVLVVMALLGPTLYIFDMFVESTGMTLGNLVEMVTYTGGIDGNTGPIYWMIWQYVSVACFAPITGLFLAKISYGRTIREMFVGIFIVPVMFVCIWFVVFGSIGFNMQTSGSFDIWASLNELGMEQTMFEVFKQFPFGIVLCAVFLVVIYLSFVTLASSATTTTAIVTTTTEEPIGEDEEPPMYLKVFWALLMAVSAYVMISYAGINGAKSFAMIGGMPTIVLEIVVTYSVWRIKKRTDEHPIEAVETVKTEEIMETKEEVLTETI